MKKIFASIGLVALGAVNSQAQYAPGLTPQESSKPWALSADLRGFYDDNYLTLPKNIPNPNTGVGSVQGARSSFGLEFSPSVSFNHSVEQTLFSASYVYDLRWFDDEENTKNDRPDQTHQFNTRLEHTFSERYKLQVNDSFVVAQEPEVLDPSISSPLRTSGNNIRNTGSIDFTAELSPLFDLHAGYANTMFAYEQLAGDIPPTPAGEVRTPSRSALLDRIEQLATLDLRWKVQPETTGIFGYQFQNVDYTSPEAIIFANNLGSSGNTFSKIRDDDSHFVFVGVDQSFTPQINGSIRAGGQYVDYYNFHTDRLSPYVDASVTYQYMQGSYVQAGVKNIHNTTDVVGLTAGDPVLDAQSTAVYVSMTQQIASRVTGSLLGQYQNTRFNGGQYSTLADDFFVAGINFAYHFNPFLLMEAGYNYNKLNSDIPYRAYTRNQVYVGVRGSY